MVKKLFFMILLSFFIFSLTLNITYSANDACLYKLKISSNIFGNYGSGWFIYYGNKDSALRWSFGTNNAKCNFLDYSAYDNNNWLTTKTCNLNYDSTSNKVKANFNITVNKLKVVNFLKDYNTPGFTDNLGNQILKNNLWMRANITYTLFNSQGVVQNITTNQILINDTGYPVSSPWDNSYLQNEVNSGNLQPGIYKVKINVTPIDGKCDFNSLKGLQTNEYTSAINSSFKTFTIFKDVDKDSWDDVGNSGSGKDLCVGTKGDILNKYQGCPTDYTKISCIGSVNFISGKIVYNNNDWGKDLYFDKLSNYTATKKLVDNTFWENIYYKPIQGSGFYSGDNGPLGNGGWIGYCELRYNVPKFCEFDKSAEVLASSKTKIYYKYLQILPSEITDFKKLLCDNGRLKLNNNIVLKSIIYAYSNPRFLGSQYNTIIRNPDGNFILNDNSKQGKISCPPNSYNCKIDINGISTLINLTGINNSAIKNIKIYKNGVLNRTEKVDPKIIALKVHKIKKFNSAIEAKNYINKSVQLMEKFDIVKNLTYTLSTNTTNVKIELSNYLKGGQIQNLTIYQIIPKSIAKSYDNITFINDGGAQRIVLDKDPIIGWYFNDTNGDTTISYNVSGNNEGGTIIITQEPILFNEGELIINYRENKTGCNQNEVHLFDLSGLDNSKILDKNTGTYQVCITDLNSSIILKNGTGLNTINISSFKWNSNISSNFNLLPNSLQLNINRNDIYWDLRIQEQNPDGNFSCLGSYDKIDQTSLFGDCGFKPKNRIWLHLGADYLAPNTTLKIPYLSHLSKAKLIAKDNIGGSGVKNTSYCIVNENNCDIDNNFINYIKDSEIILSCQTDWGCTKTIKYFSTDNVGNIETTKVENIYLIDKGSACQADCTAKPAPNRYLKECRNLNGCAYAKSSGEFGEQIGLAVAKSCNFLTSGSWVKYNSTNEIKCPSGPFRSSRFTNILTQITAPNCKNLIKIPYPIIFEGQRLTMTFITCFDK